MLVTTCMKLQLIWIGRGTSRKARESQESKLLITQACLARRRQQKCRCLEPDCGRMPRRYRCPPIYIPISCAKWNGMKWVYVRLSEVI